MKKGWIIFVLILVHLVAQAQPQSKFYTKLGGDGIDIGYAVKQTLEGNYIIAGSTTFYGAGNSDVVLTKLDSMGVTKWSRTLGGFNNDVAKSIVQLPDSSFIIAGFTNSFGNGGYDALVIKTDKNGNQLWLKTFGGTDWDFGYDLIRTGDGNLVMCGVTSSFGKGKNDAFVVKFDPAGNFLWQKYFGGVEDDEFKGIYTKNGTEIYVAGTTKSYGDLKGDMLLFKINTNGDSLMRIIYGGSEADNGNDVTIDKFNNLFLAGASESYTSGKKDGLVVKFSLTGTYLNRTNLGNSSGNEEIFKIIPTTSEFGEIVVIYAENQNIGTKTDFLTLAMNENLFYIVGGNNGSFGFNQEEEPYDICNTRDKGYAQVGFTKSLNALDMDILFVKRDSSIRYGTQVVGLNEKMKLNGSELKVYPNPVPANGDVSIKNADIYGDNINLFMFDLYGRLIKVINFMPKDMNNTFNIADFPAGVYLLKIELPQGSYYCKISKL